MENSPERKKTTVEEGSQVQELVSFLLYPIVGLLALAKGKQMVGAMNLLATRISIHLDKSSAICELFEKIKKGQNMCGTGLWTPLHFWGLFFWSKVLSGSSSGKERPQLANLLCHCSCIVTAVFGFSCC